jgi:hypothetical protein
MPTRRYGCPYQGSKDCIAEAIVAALPSAETFVDLFAGGCAVTHAAMVSGRYSRFVANDFGRMPQVFVDAIHGAASDRNRWLKWVSRERFYAEREKPEDERDPALMSVWSFGNNGSSYLYGRHVEPWKHALWRARVDGDFDGLKVFGIVTDDASRRAVIQHHEKWKQKYVAWFKARHGADAKADIGDARHCGNLQRLESLERLQSLEIRRGDYRDVPIPPRSVVYCDPPYQGTDCKAYSGGAFDHAAFWEWVRSRPFPVYVSEYHAPGDFAVWGEIDHNSRMSNKGMFAVKERVFVHRRFAKEFSLWL